MFKSKDIYVGLTLSQIFEQVSEEELFKYYCPNFEEINKPFCSDLYKDRNPDCRIFYNSKHQLVYKDFGEIEHYFKIIDYLQFKYSKTFKEVLEMITKDMGLLANYERKPRKEMSLNIEPTVVIKESTKIYISPRTWNIFDFYYWNDFGLEIKDVEKDTTPCRHVYVCKGDNTVTLTSTKENPIYAYSEYDYETGDFLGYKVYIPKNSDKKYRFISCADVSKSIPGWDELPATGKLLIITKSRKDVKCLRKMGIDSICLQAESNNLSVNIVNDIQTRFEEIVLLYDNDSTGMKSAAKITEKYGFKSIIIPPTTDCKDVSELIAKTSLNNALNVIKKLTNEITLVR